MGNILHKVLSGSQICRGICGGKNKCKGFLFDFPYLFLSLFLNKSFHKFLCTYSLEEFEFTLSPLLLPSLISSRVLLAVPPLIIPYISSLGLLFTYKSSIFHLFGLYIRELSAVMVRYVVLFFLSRVFSLEGSVLTLSQGVI